MVRRAGEGAVRRDGEEVATMHGEPGNRRGSYWGSDRGKDQQ